MNDKPTYDKWVGVLLGFFLTGSAHYLSGKRRAGLMWFFGLLTITVMALALMFIPGTVPYVISLAMLLVAGILWFLMLKQSFTHVSRIGVPGWIGLIALSLVLCKAEEFLILQSVTSFRMGCSVSMQPTLLGANARDMWADSPDRPGFFQWIFTGNRFREIKVTEGGVLTSPPQGAASRFMVGSKTYELPFLARPLKRPGEHIAQGETLWSGVVTSGDWVLVDKLSYRLGSPKRGDLLVFKTEGFTNSSMSGIYLKRIAGLPGESIRIDPPDLMVDDKKLTMPAIFQAIASKTDGHAGFLLATPSSYTGARLVKPTDEMVLGKDEYFVLGDNTQNSLDSRYFGPVPKKNIVGKAARIHWPFTRINALDKK